MFNRLKKAWALSKTPEVNILTMMDEKQKSIDLAVKAIEENKVLLGNGNAEFFRDPTAADELEHEREMDGTKSWLDRLKNL